MSGVLSSADDYIYPGTSNKLSEVQDASTTATLRDFTYSAGGDITGDVRTGTGSFVYVYDEAGRLEEVKVGGVTQATYGYDAFERRASRNVSGGASVHYLYDANGRPLAEHSASTGAMVKEYVWLGDLMIAMVTPTATYAVHGGHLGQPLMTIDASKAVVWDADSRQTAIIPLCYPAQNG